MDTNLTFALVIALIGLGIVLIGGFTALGKKLDHIILLLKMIRLLEQKSHLEKEENNGDRIDLISDSTI